MKSGDVDHGLCARKRRGKELSIDDVADVLYGGRGRQPIDADDVVVAREAQDDGAPDPTGASCHNDPHGA
jgi:hypothetical protein